jgi:hypothetical protein
MDQRIIYVAGLLMAAGLHTSVRFSAARWLEIVESFVQEIDEGEQIVATMRSWLALAGEVAFIAEVLGLKGFPETSKVVSDARERLKEIIEGGSDELH